MTSSLHIRQAIRSDAPAMADISKSNYFKAEELMEHADQGFTIWPRTQEFYEKAIDNSEYVAVAEEDNEIIGHVLCYPLTALKALNELTLQQSSSTQFFLATYPPETVFVDQISIKRSHLRKGVGKRLDQYLRENTPNEGKWVTDIVHMPVRNKASIAFFEAIGFKGVNEVKQDQWTLGLYERLEA